MIRVTLVSLLLWVLGCVGIVWGSNKLYKSILERDEANARVIEEKSKAEQELATAYRKGMEFAGKDARNKMIIMSNALVLYKQNELTLEDTLKVLERNTSETAVILDGLIEQTEQPIPNSPYNLSLFSGPKDLGCSRSIPKPL